MKQAVKRFILFAMLAIFVLLTVLLGVINGTNFTMAAEDADRITEMISMQDGALLRGPEMPHRGRRFSIEEPEGDLGRFDTMGPASPELTETMRFFTVAFDKTGAGQLIAYRISAVTEDEAIAWAASLHSGATGWTNRAYRYRVYEKGGTTFVTVIDQSRELLPSYRILIISVIGEAAAILISLAVLLYAAKALFRPIEEADRKQKRFIADAESEFKVPLTVISANTEQIETERGPSEPTRAIHRQVNKMTDLVRKLGQLAVFTDNAPSRVALGELLQSLLTEARPRFEEKGIALSIDVDSGVTTTGNRDALAAMLSELIENALRYGEGSVSFTLKTEQARIILRAANGASLPDGSYDQVFDRFTTLSNGEGPGLGLAQVKEIVKQHDGRLRANEKDGIFTVAIDL